MWNLRACARTQSYLCFRRIFDSAGRLQRSSPAIGLLIYKLKELWDVEKQGSPETHSRKTSQTAICFPDASDSNYHEEWNDDSAQQHTECVRGINPRWRIVVNAGDDSKKSLCCSNGKQENEKRDVNKGGNHRCFRR